LLQLYHSKQVLSSVVLATAVPNDLAALGI
jgi:hypothetical protein